jgi:hypothetical protein
MDERMCSDTVMRVCRLSEDWFVVYDLVWLNGINLADTTTYSNRLTRIGELIEAFHHPDLTALILPEDVPTTIPLRGWETYDDTPGSMGVFIPASK